MKRAAKSTCTVKGYISFVLQWDYPFLHERGPYVGVGAFAICGVRQQIT